VLTRIFVVLSAVVFVAVNPYLEIGETHLFNPDWSGHVRLHNAWQLIANAAFSLLAVWLVFRGNSQRLAAIIALIVPGSFLLAFLIRGTFGGTLAYADGSMFQILGYSPVVAIVTVLTVGLAYCAVTAGAASDSERARS